MPHFTVTSSAVMIGLLLTVLTGCGGARIHMINPELARELPDAAQVDVYVGQLQQPHTPLAIIESEAFPRLNDRIKREQIEMMRAQARRLGANAVQELRILSKYRHGFVNDERVPVQAWRQGSQRLYFLRGVAVRVDGLESTGDESPTPSEGWVIERLEPPRPLERSEILDLMGDRLAERPEADPAPLP